MTLVASQASLMAWTGAAQLSPASLSNPRRICSLKRSAAWVGGRSQRVTTTTTTPSASGRRYRPYTNRGSPPPDRDWEPSSTKQKEPFDAELTVLFGLPTVVLGLPLVIEEPASLVFLVPLLVLIPGVRDVASSVMHGFAVGAFRAKDFMSEPQQAQQQGAAARRGARWQPPPPPPVDAAGGYYQPPPPQQGSSGLYEQQEPYGGPYGGHSSWEQPTPSSPSPWQQEPATWPGAAPPSPYSPFARSAQTPDSMEGRPVGPTSTVGPPSGWPAAPGPQPPGTDVRPGNLEGAAWAGLPPRSGAPLPRGSVMAVAVAEGGRVVRPSGRGRVGIDIEGGGSPVWVRPLLLLFPWLKSWGGLL